MTMASTQIEDTGHGAVAWLRRRQDGPAASVVQSPLYTIADVSKASGLPGPAIMQLVSRTWTAQGYMYTTEQLQAAVSVATELRRQRNADSQSR